MAGKVNKGSQAPGRFGERENRFPVWLRAELKRRAWTQRRLAQEMGINEGTVNQWAQGRRPTPASLDAIAHALDVDPNRLLELTGQRDVDWAERDSDEKDQLISAIRATPLTPQQVATVEFVVRGMARYDEHGRLKTDPRGVSTEG